VLALWAGCTYSVAGDTPAAIESPPPPSFQPAVVADGSFSGTAHYHLTLRGSQRGETSFWMQVLNAVTLSLVPYSVTQRYDFQYVLEDAHTGARYNAAVQASDKTWVKPLLVLTLPWYGRGPRETMTRVGDALYDQFRRQGAFVTRAGAPTCRAREAIAVDPFLNLAAR
jgi:hypothetical protein